ncbi:MAG: ATP-binding cassette domain-containing protein [Ruminococcus sp.]|nr:ATP-binding cassette domain-containing protein [Ruminococcus sp.]
MALLTLSSLNFTYASSTSPALKDVSLTVNEGDFILLCGNSGCGKTTLMRLIKPQLAPNGKLDGEILFDGRPLSSLTDREAACGIGYVMQNPETQIVTDTCISELAFGLQSLGMDSDAISAKIGEVAGFFGIGDRYGEKTHTLSGGQKQLLSLASVMAMKPSLLLLDEPTSQLDPVAAREFLDCLKKLNDELGVTVIMSEHRLDEAFPLANRVVMLENGSVLLDDTPENMGRRLRSLPNGGSKRIELPTPLRIYRALGGSCDAPLTVKDGRAYIAEGMKGKTPANEAFPESPERTAAVSLRDIYFSYEKDKPILDGLCLDIKKGELLCILGGNACGKTTLQKLICGLIKPTHGEMYIDGRRVRGGRQKGVVYLPQNPLAVFTRESVDECFADLASATDMPKSTLSERKDMLLEAFGLASLADRHPYDLSGGEQQRAAIALSLLSDPAVLLLDEPTKGQDALCKEALAAMLHRLTESGKTVVITTHDLDFAAENGDRTALIFGGRIVSIGESTRFFAANDYYTTAAARMTRPFFKTAVTANRAAELCAESGFRHE